MRHRLSPAETKCSRQVMDQTPAGPGLCRTLSLKHTVSARSGLCMMQSLRAVCKNGEAETVRQSPCQADTALGTD
ncbi:hypothetical protein L798_02552 [Zootermopsis nevadensis]|uniref:Uncharacterized protein n=1 Tax=Zootermopsis nevadensis TaxID=136037 RepID=A0A067RGA8_ZOONE|nr:hypothetical protein L798_02552 [Zootermopsis nevadensis]